MSISALLIKKFINSKRNFQKIKSYLRKLIKFIKNFLIFINYIIIQSNVILYFCYIKNLIQKNFLRQNYNKNYYFYF